MGQRATATIYPVKVRHYEEALDCTVQGVVGYRASCSCGWRSTTHKSVQVARVALFNHRDKCSSDSPEAASATSEPAA